MTDHFDDVLSMAQTLIRAQQGKLTRELIQQKAEMILQLNLEWAGVNLADLVKELETRFNIHIGKSTTLEDLRDHVSWLPARSAEISWTYWKRYRRMLETRMAPPSLDSLDRSTDTLVGLLEDPERPGPWDRRGLVVGHVQSGKTASYTGLICKAADAGYKLVIVLAGMHSNLRAQTQMRLDEGFLGYDSFDKGPPIGVGRQPGEITNRPDTITNRSEGGDFARKVAESFSITPGGKPLLFVIKKNVSVLKNLLAWVKFAAPKNALGKHVTDVPLLVIDDEADNASIDTRAQSFDGNKPDLDHEPTRINRQIRSLLAAFARSAYVGYTATPFANIFIHDKGQTEDEGEDLFPRSFIVNLPIPSNYCGPAKIFGLDTSGYDDDETLPLVRLVTDFQEENGKGWMPLKHKIDQQPLFQGNSRLPDSLEEALLSFLLTCAVRRYRGHLTVFNSMLIHVTRFVAVQGLVTGQVQNFINDLRREVKYAAQAGEFWDRLEQLYIDDFSPTSLRFQARDKDLVVPLWDDLVVHIKDSVERLQLRQINGAAGDVLDYLTYKDTGLDVIAIGGDKLARGLTLEGLSVSYFLRASSMYDTLMQMGRWFGYRPGYLDLCRLYTTGELCEWFEHIAVASEELRQEFDYMATIGSTPQDYGLKVKSHPALMVTSRVKMKHGTELLLSYAASLSETVIFEPGDAAIEKNMRALEALIPDQTSYKIPRPSVFLWRDVKAERVIQFLESYRTHPGAVLVNSSLLARYVRIQQGNGELTKWTIALCAGQKSVVDIAGMAIPGVKRQKNKRGGSDYNVVAEGKFTIRRLLSPGDEFLDLSEAEYKEALQITLAEHARNNKTPNPPQIPNGPAIRAVRSKHRGLLLIYPIVVDDEAGFQPKHPLVGIGVSLPQSPTSPKVPYVVNNPFYEGLL